jgi:hypothetical protein
MRTTFCAAVVAVLGLTITPRQVVPPAQPSQPSNTQTVRIRGCLDGRSIRPVHDSDPMSLPSQDAAYRLKGSKAMMATLKEHDGHEDEITGTTKIATPDKSKAMKEEKVGRARVYVEAGSDKSPGGILGSEDFTIDVATLTHVKPSCRP